MKPSINLTIIFIVVGVVTMFGIIGGVVLTLWDKDATAFYGFFAVSLTSLGGFAGVLYGQNRQLGKIEEVRANTNGNLTRLLDMLEPHVGTRAEATVVRETREQLSTDEINIVGNN